MNRLTLAVAAASLISLATPGNCLAQRGTLTATIPFSFGVGSKTLAAGNYQVASLRLGAGVLDELKTNDGKTVLVVSSIGLDPKPGQAKSTLVFHHYGQQFFLAQIWYGDGKGRQFAESAQEEEARRMEPMTTVAVAMKPNSSAPAGSRR
jgi:hypothetical protein